MLHRLTTPHAAPQASSQASGDVNRRSMLLSILQSCQEPDWAAKLTAYSTFALALGVGFAGLQLKQDRRFRRVEETGGLFKEFEDSNFRDIFRRIDKDFGHDNKGENDRIERNRKRAFRLYMQIKNLPKNHKKYSAANKITETYIRDITRIANRMEIYISRGVADIDLIADHLVYEIVSMYYFAQDILRERSSKEDFDYEGVRNLASRMQDNSKLRHINLSDELKYAYFPLLPYRDGDLSKNYRRSLCLKFRLWWHANSRNFQILTKQIFCRKKLA
jgi:hypothetical protein